ncbi:type II toxin-antitoxin system HipA family toxin [Burkholderia cepacia]|uniref:type II toxin-antitoxin system HipA family toxin n=1 Tax=Burkholderia cepacia TaxID=292 RepID=UPI00075EE009|nr:HipA domain-containing protein [Burkholderia cepacia]KVA42442.1 toxin HipA [Burkholderia cepacia]KVC18498.1 toxin HipA [Burkholderia cepacia]
MTTIGIYADWDGLAEPQKLGLLHSRKTRASERFEFQYASAALAAPEFANVQIDPAIGCFDGPQYPVPPRETFGAFADSSPDRWGRMLMDRRLERDIRAGLRPKGTRLHESDYLLGVHDLYRVGALRYKLDDTGEFLDDRHDLAAPPFAEIRELERASRALEEDVDNTAPNGRDWLSMLIAPGGSLGGARPKASVADDQGRLYIAKFPSARDDYDVGGWEMVVNALAVGCGLNVAHAEARKFASEHHCFLVRRFDRTAEGRRLHFASAMTMTNHVDGDDASTGDHLRNHGFILVPGAGWRLSAAYDMNPVAVADGLKLNITEADNALDLELAREVCEYFRLKLQDADEIIADFSSIVGQWRTLATRLALPAREQERMAGAFHLASA